MTKPSAICASLKVCWVVVLASAGQAHARSTFTAHAAPSAVFGPGAAQTVAFQLSYFPGDGEAVVRLRLEFGPGTVQVQGARSDQGLAETLDAAVAVEYGRRPLAGEGGDTVSVQLVPLPGAEYLPWTASLFSSLDAEGPPAHAVNGRIAVQPPLQAAVQVSPQQVFAGEQVELLLLLRNQDELGRAIEQTEWRCPGGLVEVAAGAPHQWPDGLLPGEQDTVRQVVQVSPGAQGRVELAGTVQAGGVAGSPLPPVYLEVVPLPTASLTAPGGVLEVGAVQEVVYTWRNASQDSVGLQALRVDPGDAFDGVSVVGPHSEDWVGSDREGQRHLLLEKIGGMAPGQEISVRVRVRPLRAGPFRWRSFAQPSLRQGFVPLSGDNEVQVVRESGQWQEAGTADRVLTDLQLVGQAFTASLDYALEDLPLGRAGQVYLQAADGGQRNWVVEDALTVALRRLGYGIRLSQPASEVPGPSVLCYRLVDARVVYLPTTRGWRVWQDRQRREAVGEVFLHLEGPDGRVLWTQRVRAYGPASVPSGDTEWLKGGEGFDRTVVERDAKLLERGLSASIVGGLLYIFFVL